MRVVTLSANYGAGGSLIAPMIAEQLGIPLLKRDAAPAVARPGEQPDKAEDVRQSRWSRILEALATVPDEYGSHLAVPAGGTAADLRAESERRMRSFVEENNGGIVVGYAGAMVLDPAFRVRLDGPLDARIARGMAWEGIDEKTARERAEHTEAVRESYWRRLYQRDIKDPYNYHLWLDTTAISIEAAAHIIVVTAEAVFANQQG